MERDDSAQEDGSDAPGAGGDKGPAVTFKGGGERTSEQDQDESLSPTPELNSTGLSSLSQTRSPSLTSYSRSPSPSLHTRTPSRSSQSRSPDSRSPDSSVVLPEIPISHDKNYIAPAPRYVKFTVTLTLGIPNGLEGDKKKVLKMSKSVRTMEASKPHKYYHMELSLLPNAEPMKLDLVTFGSAAKTYMGNDSQVLRPWDDGERLWLVFRHNVELPITKELLLRLGSHLITLQIWDSKEKVSSKAKFDRPKGLRLLMEKEITEGEKLLVHEQLKLLENSPLVTTYKKPDDIHPEELINLGEQDAVISSHDGLPETSKAALQPQSEEKLCGDLNQNKLKTRSFRKKMSMTSRIHVKPESRIKVAEDEAAKKDKDKTLPGKKEQRNLKKKGAEKQIAGVIKLDTRLLLAGDKSVTNKMDDSVAGILDAIFTVSVDKSLMSEEMERELNPMVIRIISANSMPSTPLPIHVLEEQCGPVYCQYKFYDLPCHQTKGRGHGTEVSFKDVNVILTGTFNPDKLREYLLGPPLEIEIHDRDRRPKLQSQPPALFGFETEDTKLSNVSLVSSKRTVHDPFIKTNKSWDPYGIAKVAFSDLLYGEKCLNVAVSIQNSRSPDPMGYQTDGLGRRILGVSGAVDGPDDHPLTEGHYLESNSVLNVRIELAYPLSRRTDVTNEIEACKFGRVIYNFDYKNKEFLHDLLGIIGSINCAALCQDPMSNGESEAADAALKVEIEQKESYHMDILTGFHVMDGRIHLFVLEGLKDKGLKKLWEMLPVRSVAHEEERITVLYNSDFSFKKRLYAYMDDYLYHVHLREPLHNIIKQPLLYIRDMTPQDCFQALCRLQGICSAKKLREVAQYDLFPSAEMVRTMSREFGIPASETGPLTTKNISPTTNQPAPKHKPSKRIHYPELDIFNENYLQMKKDQTFTDHIQANIDAVYKASKKLMKTKRGTIATLPLEGKAVYIYSNQTLNSAEQAKELLRQEMALKPNYYFTYNQEFLSATVARVDVDIDKKRAKERLKSAWLTSDGFRYPGFKSSLDANEHPKKPDDARIHDLRKAWKEHILYANVYTPVLPRDRWKWNERNKDFDLYKKIKYSPPPVSIHLAGATLRAEQLETIYKSFEDWRSKLIADNTQDKCCPRHTDFGLRTTEPDSCTQLDKPGRATLKQPHTTYSDGEDLLRCKSPDQREITKGFAPGLNDKRGWKMNSNVIPRYDMEHKKFADLRGNDFNIYCNKRSRIYNRNSIL
ncbi:uncharacterized protein cfap92 isoform X2 [Scyliorhinus torazame]|uniref:uncharacterized protein cfap92 isoform X2 n=1 Tax=Scyliorhinus torazame TaxID=75743 RepID=UPI003B5B0A32